MLNSRRGASVIVSAILLIAVATSAALVLWSAFSFPSLPQSDADQVLENIKIVKVTPGDGNVLVYVMNRGATQAVIDSVYLESPFGDLNQSYPISPRQLDPGEILVIPLDVDLNLDEPVGIKVVTVEGAQSAVLVMNASEASYPETTPVVSVMYFDKLPVQQIYNNTVYDLSDDDRLQELDIASILMSTNETIINATSGTSPIIGECENVTRINDFLWHSEDKLKNRDLYLRVVYGGSINASYAERIIVEMDLAIQPKPNFLEIKFFNWTSGTYVTSGPGYMYLDVNRPNWNLISMIVPTPSPDFINSNGNFKFAIDTMHYAGQDNSIVNFKLLTVAVVASTSSQLLDSTFVFELPPGISEEELVSMSFTMTYCFNYSPISFDFRIYDYSASSWVNIQRLNYGSPAGEYTTVDLSPSGVLTHYVNDSKVSVKLYSVVYGAPPFQISIDVLRLRIGAITIE
ncbi:MAG: hypothetical protein ACQXXL_00375 [Candidatus Methanosuratincola sp.]